MKKFFVALFSVVALLAVVVPSSASDVQNVERETNAERLARGLPPKAPTRRSTAHARRSSPTPPKQQYIVVYDSNGNPLGFVQKGGSTHGIHVGDKMNFPVTFDSTTHTVFSSGSGDQYLGGHNQPTVIMGSNLATSTFLERVSVNNKNSETDIWYPGPNNELLAKWTNPSGPLVPIYFFETQTGSILMTGDPNAFSDLEQIHLFLESF